MKIKNLKNIKKPKGRVKIKAKKIGKGIKKSENNKSNIKKKDEIDKILGDFRSRLFTLKQKRDVVVSDFLEVLKQKHIEELKNKLKY